MAQGFMRRKIKEDGKGYFVHYGPYRIRPFSPKKTKLKEGEIVSMVESKFSGCRIEMHVFNNLEEYETWKTNG